MIIFTNINTNKQYTEHLNRKISDWETTHLISATTLCEIRREAMGGATNIQFIRRMLIREISLSSTSRNAQGGNNCPLNLIKQLSPIRLEK